MKPRRGHSKDYQNRNIKLAIADIIWYRIFQWWCILRTLKLHPSPHTSQPKLWQNYLSEAPSDKGVEHTKNCFDKNAPIHDHLKITFIRFACALSLFPCPPPPNSKKMLLPFSHFAICSFLCLWICLILPQIFLCLKKPNPCFMGLLYILSWMSLLDEWD